MGANTLETFSLDALGLCSFFPLSLASLALGRWNGESSLLSCLTPFFCEKDIIAFTLFAYGMCACKCVRTSAPARVWRPENNSLVFCFLHECSRDQTQESAPSDSTFTCWVTLLVLLSLLSSPPSFFLPSFLLRPLLLPSLFFPFVFVSSCDVRDWTRALLMSGNWSLSELTQSLST